MQNTLSQINRLIRSIDNAKPEKARMEGEKKILLEALKNEFNIDTLKEANALLESLKKELAVRREKVQEQFEKLKAGYQW
ncbi:MAG: hypothetical protein EHM49_00420 [Deltaproteobacteria bacterium]|nr:MAG: hypothetical protein EHM49_00420 [Deltaproteobacteria bacterium]